MKPNRLHALIYILPFLSLIFVVPIFAVIDKDADKSLSENRALQQFPTKSDLQDWTFTAKYETYINDQLPQRDPLIKSYTQYEMAMDKHFIRNLYIAESDHLFLIPSLIDDGAIQKAAERTNLLKEEAFRLNKEVFFAITPRKNTALSELLIEVFRRDESKKVALFEDELTLPKENVINLSTYFKKQYSLQQRSDFYFRSDFHWNANGAIAAFTGIYNQLNAQLHLTTSPFNPELFKLTTLKEAQFLGDLNRRLQNQLKTEELIAYYELPNPEDLTVLLMENNQLKKVAPNRIYAAHVDQEKVNYNDLFTTNLGYYKIKNNRALTHKKILIFKDSYQNATLPFFVKYFEQLEVVDQRYLGKKDCYDILNESSADIVLIMYNDGNIFGPMYDFNKSIVK